MYYESGTVDRIASGKTAALLLHEADGTEQMLRVHSPDGSTFLPEMTSWPPS